MEISRSLVNRMTRAAKLDVDFYEEVEADTTANGQALLAVVLVSLATGIGTGIAGLAAEEGPSFISALLVGLASSIIGWLAWSGSAYILGTTIFKGPETSATWGELLRTIGFSNSPGALRLFCFIPFIGGIVAFVASVWSLVAGIIAVRQALDFSTGRAIATCVVGWLIYMLIVSLAITLLFGTGAPF